MEPWTRRVRVVFENRRALTKAQRRQGLRRSWLLLRPDIDTVAALSSHILRTFDLRQTCPKGLLLSIDEFVLPSFESTQIIRDGDVISVREKGYSLAETVKAFQETEVIDKQPLLLHASVLASTEFENESGGYESEDEENLMDQASDMVYQEIVDSPIRSKRKRSSSRPSSSKKKKKKNRPGDCTIVSVEGALEENGADEGISPRKNRSLREVSKSKDQKNADQDAPSTSKNAHVEGVESQQTQPAGFDATDKIPSRSARRKKAKRRWLRELKNKEQKEPELNAKHVNDVPTASPVHDDDTESDSVEDFVPIVIKPGHIRFGPAGQDETPVPLPEASMKWNGTVNKRKGQKWGREDGEQWAREDDSSDGMTTEVSPVEKSNALALIDQESKSSNPSRDFNNLPLLKRLPKKGDVITYKVVELSSSWCPELSSFRVGKVGSFDSDTSMIVLDPVPGHPISIPKRTVEEEDEDEDEDEEESYGCLYKEDGTLEIEYASLHDVRLFDGQNPSAGVGEPVAKDLPCGNNNSTEREPGNVWDELSRALEQKKEELSQKKWPATGGAAWSLRALRKSALGPTVSLLRSNNVI